MRLYRLLRIFYTDWFYSRYHSKFLLKVYKLIFLWPLEQILVRFRIHSSKEHPTMQIDDNIVNKDIVVSLTTMPSRIKNVHHTIESILRQTMLPDRIVLNLCKEELDNAGVSLTKELQAYERNNMLKIHWVKENLKPHKKYFEVIQDYRDKHIITIDDDIWYDEKTIEKLWNIHINHPNCVCAHIIRVIQINNNQFLPYLGWLHQYPKKDSESMYFLGIGEGGVLYPPHIFDNSNLFDLSTLKETALRADDLWLKAHELCNGIAVASGNYICCNLTIPTSQKVSLTSINNNKHISGNDAQWALLNNKFQLINYFISDLQQNNEQ